MSWEDLQDWRGTDIAVPNTLEILHFITKPVVDAAFLQDWLAFLSQEQEFSVHLFYAPQAFDDEGSQALTERFPGVQLFRIEKVSPHPASVQPVVFLADYLDLKYLSQSVRPCLVHTHDSRSLLLARYFFSLLAGRDRATGPLENLGDGGSRAGGELSCAQPPAVAPVSAAHPHDARR
jgi:hypothetical protein